MKKYIAAVLAAVILWVAAPITARADTPAASSPVYHGIDIYHGTSSNGQIDWSRLAASIQFLYIKADEGENWVDPMFVSNAAAATSVSIPWGPYHFLRMYSPESAKRQAANYYSRIRGKPYSLVPAVDVESFDGQETAAGVRACVRAFVDEFKSLAGYAPLLYTSTYFANSILRGQFTDCKLWLADYRGYAGDVVGWGAWHAWQYSESGRLEAIDNDEVDLNRGTDGIFLSKAPSFTGSAAMLTDQQKLNRIAIPRPLLEEDGLDGPLTRSAVRVLEQVGGLTLDAGIWGPQCESAYGAIISRPTLLTGSRGLTVSFLQYRMGIAFDGIYGPLTTSAVQAYQRAHGLTADGIVGPQTWQSLIAG